MKGSLRPLAPKTGGPRMVKGYHGPLVMSNFGNVAGYGACTKVGGPFWVEWLVASYPAGNVCLSVAVRGFGHFQNIGVGHLAHVGAPRKAAVG